MGFYQMFILTSLTVITILVLLISRRQRKELNTMQGMMLSMFFSMNTGLTLGILLGALYQGNLFYSTIITCIVSVIPGLIIGSNFGILAVLEGIMTGLMSGMMGAMLGEMINQEQSIVLVRIFLFLAISTFFILAIFPKKNNNENLIILKPLLLAFIISIYFLGGVPFAEKQLDFIKPPIHKNHAQTLTDTSKAMKTKDIIIQAESIKYFPTEIVLERKQQVNLILKNKDNVEHDIEVKIPTLNKVTNSDHNHGMQEDLIHLHAESMGTKSITFTPIESGTYAFLCTIPGHKELGMVGKIIVK